MLRRDRGCQWRPAPRLYPGADNPNWLSESFSHHAEAMRSSNLNEEVRMKRKGMAVWKGGLVDGQGGLSTESGGPEGDAVFLPHAFRPGRRHQPRGTHRGGARGLLLDGAGESVDGCRHDARGYPDHGDGKPRQDRQGICDHRGSSGCRGDRPGQASATAFQTQAATAKAGCLVSRILSYRSRWTPGGKTRASDTWRSISAAAGARSGPGRRMPPHGPPRGRRRRPRPRSVPAPCTKIIGHTTAVRDYTSANDTGDRANGRAAASTGRTPRRPQAVENRTSRNTFDLAFPRFAKSGVYRRRRRRFPGSTR